MNKTGDAVRVEHLTKIFGSFTAVDHISFNIRRGEIFGFLGPNGAGKSTTIRMLCGILRPTSGLAWVAGLEVADQPDEIKAIIGYMSQKFTLYGDLTVEENLRFFCGIHGLKGKKIDFRLKEILRLTGLEDRSGYLAGELPGGWKQRLSLGCAILHEPQVLFLDEPTASVDPAARKDFWDLIYHLSEQGTTVFVSSHYMDEVERTHRLAIMYSGKIIALGRPQELKEKLCGTAQASLEEAFIEAIKKAKSATAEDKGAEEVW